MTATDQASPGTRILLVEDSPDDRFLIERHLRRSLGEIVVTSVATLEDLRAALADPTRSFDVLLTDYHLPGFDGLDACRLARDLGFEGPALVVSGALGEELAVEAMRAGLDDYVLKENLDQLGPKVTRARRERAEDLQLRAEMAELEQQLTAAQRLESIGALAGGVAHDFNNILGVVLAATDLILETQDLSPEVEALALDIEGAATRGSRLVDQLLAFSRQKPTRPVPVDLAARLQALDPLLRRALGDRISLDVEVRPGTPPALIDPDQFDQVMISLALNAADAITDVGHLKVRIRSPSQPGPPDLEAEAVVLLEVRDDGCGMSPEVQARLFEPFFTTKPQGKGTGLGLASVFGILKRHGGVISVESEVGTGTCFRLWIPSPAEADERSADPGEDPRRPGDRLRPPPRILLVDDEGTLLKLSARALRKAGYRVHEAEDGDTALRVHAERAGDFDLLVTDVSMPRMSGPDLAARLREVQQDLPVLFISGYTGPFQTTADPESVGGHFLAKPFTSRALRDEVRRILETPGARAAAPAAAD